jgi:hypothetical protein
MNRAELIEALHVNGQDSHEVRVLLPDGNLYKLDSVHFDDILIFIELGSSQ